MDELEQVQQAQDSYEAAVWSLQTGGNTNPAIYDHKAAVIESEYRKALGGILEATEAAAREYEAQESLAEMEPAEVLTTAEMKEAASLLHAIEPAIRQVSTANLILRAEEASEANDRASTYAFMQLLQARADELEKAPIHSRDRGEILATLQDLSATIKGISGPVDKARVSRVKRARVEAIRQLNKINARTYTEPVPTACY
jgi:hypothetical protein